MGNSVGAIPWFLRNHPRIPELPRYHEKCYINGLLRDKCYRKGLIRENVIERGYSVKKSILRGYSRKTAYYLYSGTIPWIFKIPWKHGVIPFTDSSVVIYRNFWSPFIAFLCKVNKKNYTDFESWRAHLSIGTVIFVIIV